LTAVLLMLKGLLGKWIYNVCITSLLSHTVNFQCHESRGLQPQANLHN